MGSAMTRICPDCEHTYDAELQCCPHCGQRLVMAPERSLIGVELDGKYAVREVIGQGGMGVVYRAHQLNMSRDVAVKTLRPEQACRPEALRRFFREVRAVSRLSHVNSITVHDFGQTAEGLPYIVMELLRGSPLSAVIRTDAPLPLGRAADIVAQVCDALGEAHAQGIIHRDLKPSNVFLAQQHGNAELVKVLDYGIAKVSSPDGSSNLTETGLIFGTPAYISPEQVQGRRLDARADLYALGVMCFEMLGGVRPFKGGSDLETLFEHVTGPVPTLGALTPGVSVPTSLELFISRTLAKEPDDRPDDAAAFKRELLACRDEVGVDWHYPVRPSRQPNRGRHCGLEQTATIDQHAAVSGVTSDPALESALGPRECDIPTMSAEPSAAIAVAPDSRRAEPTSALLQWPIVLVAVALVAVVSLVLVLPHGCRRPRVVSTVPLAQASSADAGPAVDGGQHAEPRTLHAFSDRTDSGQADAAFRRLTRLTVNSHPVGAEVLRGGLRICVTPCQVDLPAGDGTERLVFRRAGYRQAQRVVRLKGDAVRLDPVRLKRRRGEGAVVGTQPQGEGLLPIEGDL